MNTLFLVMPAYNEEETIENVVKCWYPLLSGKSETSRLVIADSGSTDKTHEILLGLKKSHPQLEILSNTGKLHGPKVIALYMYAIEQGADFVFQTDSDGQTDPSEFEAFWQIRNLYDGIFGYRKERGDGALRSFVEKVVCLLLNFYFDVRVPDANAPFRLMKVSTLKKYITKLPKDYNLPNVMITTYFVHYKERYSFRAITFKARQGGVNSINFIKIIKIGLKAIGDFRAFKQQMQ